MNDDAKSLDDFWNVIIRLKDDANRCLSMLESTEETDAEGKSFWRRMYARAVFALLDSVVYGMMFHAFVTRNRPDVEFSPNELDRLEMAYDFDEDNEPVYTFSRGRMVDDIKFAFTAFARVHCCNYRLPTDDPTWGLVKETAYIRNWMRHPRIPEQVEVYDEHIDVLLHGLAWLIECVVELQKSCVEAMLEPPPVAETDEIVM